MTSSLLPRLLLGATACTVLLLAGCGGPPATAGVTAPVPASAPAPAPPAFGPEAVRLSVATTTLGPTVTVGGRTLYRFEGDVPKPPQSLCVNDCAEAWPPLLTDGTPPVLEGVDAALVGTITREDGSTQVTLADWPLYRFVDDERPGDVKGENVGGNWSAVGPDGKPLVRK